MFFSAHTTRIAARLIRTDDQSLKFHQRDKIQNQRDQPAHDPVRQKSGEGYAVIWSSDEAPELP